MTQSTRERSLTPPEKDERTQVFRVRASRDELREWRVEARKLATQIDEVRQEIRTGIVTEPAQQDLPHMEKPPARVWPEETEETEDECSARTVREEMRAGGVEPKEPPDPPRIFITAAVHEANMAREARASVALDNDPECGTRVCEGIDGSSDEPDEETDPPPPAEDPAVNAVSDHDLLALLGTLGVQVDLGAIQSWSHRQLYYAKLWALAPGAWPRPAHFQLLDAIELRHLITCVRPKEAWPTVKAVESWHEQVRFDVQRWCCIEHARNGHIAGHPMPVNGPMPSVLANLEPGTKKPAKAAKKKRTRKVAP